MVKAILYDLDGVLVDACEWHYISLNMALKEICGDVISRVEHETVFNGLPTKKKLDILSAQGRIKDKDMQIVWDRKQALTIQAINENSSADFDKIILHEFTQSMGIKSVCVTNSIKETATLMLERTEQLQFMQFVITNEMVKNPKPHGEGYIRAMISLGVMPDECVIVEDSEKGLKAAATTACHIIAVRGPAETCSKVREFLNASQKT